MLRLRASKSLLSAALLVLLAEAIAGCTGVLQTGPTRLTDLRLAAAVASVALFVQAVTLTFLRRAFPYTGISDELLSGRSAWRLRFLIVLFAVAALMPIAFAASELQPPVPYSGSAAQVQERDGHYYRTNHGTIEQEITRDEYDYARDANQIGAQAAGVFVIAVSAMLLVQLQRPRDLEELSDLLQEAERREATSPV